MCVYGWINGCVDCSQVCLAANTSLITQRPVLTQQFGAVGAPSLHGCEIGTVLVVVVV